MLYDCFTFFNELDLLEIRLNVLNDVVDKFVIVEADRTFSNRLKPLIFAEHRERFRMFSGKIVHVVIDMFPALGSAWEIEQYQRNAVARGLEGCCDDDVILISDLDEIPSPQKVLEYANTPGVKLFEQKKFYYFLNYLNVTDPVWCQGTKMLSYRDFKTGRGCMEEIYDPNFMASVNAGVTATRVRLMKNAVHVKDGGWHFSYIGGYEAIADKIRSFSHQEFNTEAFTSIDRIKRRVDRGEDLFGRDYRYAALKLDARFPQYIRDHKEKYSHLLNERRALNAAGLFLYRWWCVLGKRWRKIRWHRHVKGAAA